MIVWFHATNKLPFSIQFSFIYVLPNLSSYLKVLYNVEIAQ